jgi:hypothetical protein
MKRRRLLAVCAGFGLLALVPGPVLANGPTPISFKELYGKRMVFSDKTLALAGQQVVIEGYMAPPLKAEASFFVMTKIPLAVCPFCDNEADWPADILFVRMAERQDFVKFNRRIRVLGRLEVGTEKDDETGFVSRLRLADAVYEIV